MSVVTIIALVICNYLVVTPVHCWTASFIFALGLPYRPFYSSLALAHYLACSALANSVITGKILCELVHSYACLAAYPIRGSYIKMTPVLEWDWNQKHTVSAGDAICVLTPAKPPEAMGQYPHSRDLLGLTR